MPVVAGVGLVTEGSSRLLGRMVSISQTRWFGDEPPRLLVRVVDLAPSWGPYANRNLVTEVVQSTIRRFVGATVAIQETVVRGEGFQSLEPGKPMDAFMVILDEVGEEMGYSVCTIELAQENAEEGAAKKTLITRASRETTSPNAVLEIDLNELKLMGGSKTLFIPTSQEVRLIEDQLHRPLRPGDRVILVDVTEVREAGVEEGPEGHMLRIDATTRLEFDFAVDLQKPDWRA